MKNNEDERRNSIGKKFRVKNIGVQKKLPNFGINFFGGPKIFEVMCVVYFDTQMRQ